ncbi:HD domain-containing protein [Geoalkalibacter ferrihydriticus]|uniref:HD domain-containing protein n=1 Tax=Geoalkalibacter ferrihydriticus TaxID=392333 RepID=A0A1G9LTW7_9BACT|nr:HD domain-containing protein [Geoalkalibacter ferrihydriticus]
MPPKQVSIRLTLMGKHHRHTLARCSNLKKDWIIQVTEQASQRLLKNFFNRSLGIVMILALALLVALPALIYHHHLRAYQQESLHLLETFIAKELDFPLGELHEPSPRAQRALGNIENFLAYADFVEFKIWAHDGRVLYAFRQREQVGLQFDNARLQTMLQTRMPHTEIEDTRDHENLDLKKFGKLVELYAPIVHGDKVVGAAEVYRVTPPFRFLGSHIFLVVSLSFLTLIMLHLLLFGRFRRAVQTVVANEEKLGQAYQSLGMSYVATIRSLARALEVRDMETEGHSERVVALAVHIGRSLELPETEIHKLVIGAFLHDLGKIGIPDDVLLRPGELSADQRTIIETHVCKGLEIIRDVAFLQPAAEVIQFHHERWDGSGYPHGLSQTSIPVAARVFAVVDVFDALLSERPYKQAFSFCQAREHLAQASGKLFDPQILEAFFQVKEEDFHFLLKQINQNGIEDLVNAAVDDLLYRGFGHQSA